MKRRRERKLVRALKERDEEAFRELVRVFQHRVFNIVYRIIGDRDEAEEVSQEVFVAVFKHIDSFRGDSKLSTWLYRIATNHAKNRVKYLSRRKRGRHQDIDETPESAVEQTPAGGDAFFRPDQEAVGQELHDILREGLQTLSEEHRAVIVLRDVEGMSYREISEVLEVAEGTVKSRLYRARVALKEYVESRYDDVAAPN